MFQMYLLNTQGDHLIKFAWLLSSDTIITDYYELLRPPGWWLDTPVITI